MPRFELQTLQDVTAAVFVLAIFFWLVWARKNPHIAGLAWAPVFYCALVVAFYVADFLFNPEPPGGASLYTWVSAMIRLVSGALLLGAPVIMLYDKQAK